jgi:hypothetical protein
VFSHFYFSCKNYQELTQETIIKVVGLFTTNLRKLSFIFLIFLRFATQFTRISKGTLLFQLPICSQALENNFPFAIWFPGARSGGSVAILAGDHRIPVGGQQGNGLGPTRVRFGGVIGGEERPAVGRTSGRRWWPPRLPIPDEGRFGGRRERVGEQQWVPGKAVGALAGGFGRPDPRLAVVASTGAGGGSGLAMEWLRTQGGRQPLL